MKKKILGVILTLVVLTIIPLAVYAAGPQLQLSDPTDIYSGTASLPYDTTAKSTVTATVAVDGSIKLSVVDLPASTDTTIVSNVSVSFNKGGDDCIKYTEGTNCITITGNELTNGVNITVTVEWNEKPKAGGNTSSKKETLTCTVKVVKKAIVNMDITGSQTTIENGKNKTNTGIKLVDTVTPGYNRFYVGDTFTVTGGKLYYNSGETRPLNPSTDTVTPVTAAFTATDRDITYSFEGKDPSSRRSEYQSFQKKFGLTVEARKKTLKGVEWNPDVKAEDRITVYDAGTYFDYSQIRLVFKEEGTNETKYVYYKVAGSSDGFTPVEKNLKMYVGIETFDISYDNEVYTFKFSTLGITTVAAKEVTASIISGGTTTYYYGDKFKFEELRLTVTEKGLNGDKKYYVYNDGFEYTEPLTIGKDTKGVTITYDTKDYTFRWKEDLGITVCEDNRTLVGLKATGTPNKYKYIEGQTVDDWGGIVFYAVYKVNGSNEKVEKQLSSDEYPYLTAKPFEYSDVYTDINTYAMVCYTENGVTTDYIKVSGFEVRAKQVESIEVTKAPNKTAYATGDTLSLTGMEITIYYDNGTKEAHSYADKFFTCTPAHGDVVSATTRSIAVTYNDGKVTKSTEFVGISVDNTAKIKTAILSKEPNKTEYEVGEKFDPTGMEVTLVFGDKDTPNYVMKDTLFKNINVVFEKTSNSKVNITVANPYDSNDKTTVTVPVTVVPKVVPTDLEVSGYKSKYLIGEYASLDDITSMTVTLSDGSKLNKDDVKKLMEEKETAKKATVKISPATKITASTKEITVTFTYKDTTVTDTYKIEAIQPVCVLSGTTTVPYESFELALEDANKLTTAEAKKVTITLNDSVVLTEKYQFNAERTIIIDLNGNDLTMDETQMFVPHKSAYKDVQIVIINSDSSDAKIIYDEKDKNKQLILGKNDELVIDWETEIPGIYEITLTAGENGKISGPQEVAFGNDAKYTITPDEGYEILEVFVDKKSKGKSATITLENVDAEHEIAASFTKKVVVWDNPFTDIYKSAPYYSAIEFVYENNLFKGMTATKFEPNTTMTRAMFVTVLGRLAGIDEYDSRYAGKSSFSDVVSSAATDWYIPYVEWASSIGLLKGYEDGTFRPNREISHTEMYILMERYARNLLGITSNVGSASIRATDTKDIPTWEGAYEAIQFASQYDFLVLGTGNKITPNDNALRYELAMLLESFCKTFDILQDKTAD